MFRRAAGRTGAADRHAVCGEHSPCPGHTGFAPLTAYAFSVYTAQAPGCSPGSGPCVVCTSQASAAGVQVLGSSTKTQTRLGLPFVPSPPSSSGSQELDWRTLPGCGAPSPLRGPSLFPGAPCVPSGKLISGCDPPGGCQPSTISGSLWLEAGSLFAVW